MKTVSIGELQKLSGFFQFGIFLINTQRNYERFLGIFILFEKLFFSKIKCGEVNAIRLLTVDALVIQSFVLHSSSQYKLHLLCIKMVKAQFEHDQIWCWNAF